MESPKIFTIEWEMMDKGRFFAFSLVNSLCLRTVLYPLTVIKTRLQVQKRHSVYKGTFDAFLKILKYEGARGLYKGFAINSIQMISGIGYIVTYEKVRHSLSQHLGIMDSRVKGLIAGGCGSLVGQTIVNPFDVISQHMMVLGATKSGASPSVGGVGANTLNINLDPAPGKRKVRLTPAIIRALYKQDGLKGFYRGYFASLNISVPSSALWWMFYPVYSDLLVSVMPIWVPHLFVYSLAGPLSGLTVSIVTNPLDVVRARIQVQRLNSISEAMSILWAEEKFGVFTKGLSARIAQTVISSFFLVLGYETLKRWSVTDQYKRHVKW